MLAGDNSLGCRKCYSHVRVQLADTHQKLPPSDGFSFSKELNMNSTPWDSEAVTKQQIFEKLRRRFGDLQISICGNGGSCAELNPDVIVISDDQSLLFEPQNVRVIQWLKRRFRLENLGIRDRIRVHPTQSRRMTIELKAAGFEVV